jgi:hypothetical protein
MCAYEATHYPCGHSTFRVATYCHFARNHPGHGCCRPWTMKRQHVAETGVCDDCADASSSGDSPATHDCGDGGMEGGEDH